MHIKKISIAGFRNLDVSECELSSGVNIIFGDNAQGKTNFLEAVYFCAFGRSLRARADGELVGWGRDSASIRLETERAGMSSVLDARLSLAGKKAVKGIMSDFIPVKHMKDLFGRLLVVMFSPEDLRLIKAGPSERRRFMDMEICQLSPVYYSDLKEYFRALKQRNALLKILQKDRGSAMRESLSVWDEQLINYGLRIIKTRHSFVEKVNKIAAEIHKNITQGAEELRLEYKAGIAAENYAAVMEKSHEKDIARGTTSDGIHTDDIEFTINEISARHFGSQGQQRTAALSAKLAEIEIIKQSTGETPILLLDDVLSELDKHRQKFLLAQISNLQTIVTCTGVESFQIKEYVRFNMQGGKVL
ncbi:MAG: DNA replication/repair protein RecF [Defluviitaleaceae bacterium]|nr:DNA replication/repair protein RecF [Defluviitaleaceae bacterium]MCL2263364.1 DNA replication/repair protein RecF [Defluviitaleaceae bacterium]